MRTPRIGVGDQAEEDRCAFRDGGRGQRVARIADAAEQLQHLAPSRHAARGGDLQQERDRRPRAVVDVALMVDGPVVLLDEVTSALDPVNEAAVHDGIERLMAGRTVVLVAHRLRTVRRADRIAFLDGGRIVEEGTHGELLRRGGRYAAFWEVAMAPAE